MPRDLWTREQLLAINMYSRIPNGSMHSKNKEVIALSKIIGRSIGAISRKLGNLKRLDPFQQARGQFGLSRGGGLEVEIWNEFYGNIESAAFQSEVIRAEKELRTIDSIIDREPELNEILQMHGKEREQLVKLRVNQAFFRSMVLAAYDDTCCITGLKKPELLVAGHIRRWADDEPNRMNPHNGLAINGWHDKAFEIGTGHYPLKYVNWVFHGLSLSSKMIMNWLSSRHKR